MAAKKASKSTGGKVARKPPRANPMSLSKAKASSRVPKGVTKGNIAKQTSKYFNARGKVRASVKGKLNDYNAYKKMGKAEKYVFRLARKSEGLTHAAPKSKGATASP